MDAITVYDLWKRYHDFAALSSLSLQIPQGSASACVGAPGSGKTTLMRILSGLCRPTSGECSVMGLSPMHERGKLHGIAGVVLDTAQLYKPMTLSENLSFFAGIHDVEENDAIDRISFLLHELDIWEGRDMKIDDLPTNVVRKAMLARALIHMPQVLLIDEPEDGLDRETVETVAALLRRLQEEMGLTIFLCTENTENAQLICDDFQIIDQGKLIAKGSLEELRKRTNICFRAALKLSSEETPPQELGLSFQDGLWQKPLNSEEEMPEIITKAAEAGCNLYEARLIRPTLEEIYHGCLHGGEDMARVITQKALDERKGDEELREKDWEDSADEEQELPTGEEPNEEEAGEPGEMV